MSYYAVQPPLLDTFGTGSLGAVGVVVQPSHVEAGPPEPSGLGAGTGPPAQGPDQPSGMSDPQPLVPTPKWGPGALALLTGVSPGVLAARLQAEEVALSKPPLEGLLAFFQMETLADALRLSRWSVISHVGLLVDIARGVGEGITARDQMLAADKLRDMAFEAAKAAGLITETRRSMTVNTTDEEGRALSGRASQRLVSIAEKVSRGLESELEAANHDFITVEAVNPDEHDDTPAT